MTAPAHNTTHVSVPSRAAGPPHAKADGPASGIDDGREEGGKIVVNSVEEALEIAVKLHQNGAMEEAEYLYKSVLDHNPDEPSALQFLGVLRHQEGRDEEALRLLKRACELAPDAAGVFMNYGNVLIEAGQAEEAVDVFKRMLELAPGNAPAWNNMGILLRTLGKVEVAEEALRKSIEIDPEEPNSWQNLGGLLLGVGRVEESVQCGLKAVTLMPESRVGRKLLGVAYAYTGQRDKAIAVFKEWLAETPDDPTAIHHLAAVEGRTPERASDGYVETVFDNFATSFDAKLENLGYRAPTLVRDALDAMIGADARVSVLDVGCGTGLVGPLVRERSTNLVGIDLSAKMLDKAKVRNAYDALEKAEFIAYLSPLRDAFDVILAADALCYVGRMEEFSANAVKALTPGGALVATFEADTEGRDIHLDHTGRYTHGEAYLVRTFTTAGFVDVACQHDVLRNEQGRPVHGWILTARRPIR